MIAGFRGLLRGGNEGQAAARGAQRQAGILWCGRRDLNPQDLRSKDFKSFAYTGFATSARRPLFAAQPGER